MADGATPGRLVPSDQNPQLDGVSGLLVPPQWRRFAAAALLLATAAGCGDGNGPRPIDGAFFLSTVNDSTPPVLVGATLNCDQYLDGADLTLAADGNFNIVALTTVDCTAAGGGVTHPALLVSGTYRRSGSTITLEVPGAAPIQATYNGTTITGTLPASPVTFPIALDVVFTRRPDL